MPDDMTLIEQEVHSAQGQPVTTTASGTPTTTASSDGLSTETSIASGAPADWRSSLPPDLQQAKTLSRYKGVPDLAKAYINLEQRLSRSISVPGPEATPEERAAFARRLGVPETPDAYDPLEQPPEGIPWNKDVESRFHKTAHSLSLTPEQVKGVKAFYTGMLQEGVQLTQAQQQQGIQQGMQQLRQQWGVNTERFVANAQALVQKYGDSELVAYLDETGLGNDPRMITFLAKMNEQFIEDSVLPPETLTLGPEAAKQKITAMNNDPKHPLWIREHPGHQAALEERDRLYQIAFNKP